MGKQKRKAKDPVKIIGNLSVLDRVVYRLLTDPKWPSTQSTVAKRLGKSKSTINGITERLLAAKVICKRGSQKTNILYSRGINYRIVEGYLKTDVENGEFHRILNDHVVSDHHYCHPQLPIWRIHPSNGGWIDIKVLEEGKLGNYCVNGNPYVLFSKEPSKMRGMEMWNSTISTTNGHFPIRYQRAINTGTKNFGIIPKGIYATGSEAEMSVERARELFFGIVKPIFEVLEKYGGWLFEKDSDRNYNFRTKLKPEFGADPHLTSIMTNFRGEKFGIPGETIDWYDKSSDSGLSGEYETGNPDLVAAINSLPETHRIVREDRSRIEDLSNYMGNMGEILTKIKSELDNHISDTIDPHIATLKDSVTKDEKPINDVLKGDDQ